MRIRWSTDFFVIEGERAAVDALTRIDACTARWIVVVRTNGGYRYVFRRDELFARLRLTKIPYDPASSVTLVEVLDLHETQSSTSVSDSAQLAPPDLSWRWGETSPSVLRYVEVVPQGVQVLAVGGDDVDPPHQTRAMPPQPSAPRVEEPTPSGGDFYDQREASRSFDLTMPAPSQAARAFPDIPDIAVGVGVAAAPPPAPADEGKTPHRYPSIEPEALLAAGAAVSLCVDLLRDEAPATSGGALALGEQAADWQTLELGVTVVSSAIDFDKSGRGKVTIRRNADSVAAHISGVVLADVVAGTEIEVHAQFWDRTRCCGSAVRRLVVGAAGAAAAAAQPSADLKGSMRVEPLAQAPDLTVFISLFDPAAPGRLHWRMVTEAFDGLPPKLDGIIDLGQDPAAEAAAMFKQFANLERGKHRARIEGFGERLWDRAPTAFRDVYWALNDHHQRPLTIQFVSDDPHLPWELMRPFRAGETHPPLALRHAVARWIGRWHGYMRNSLSAGRLVTVAPKYKSASMQLSLAESTAASLVSQLGAEALEGTLKCLQALLETPTGKPIALLYFTGHGAFSADAVSASAIKLQDGNMTVDEVARREVTLGERDGTLVFFNACEVGATGNALGSVGGWADAFLSRHFRAFIAPLWAIDEEDAAQVTQELMRRIVTDRAPVGAALRDLRAKYGDVSPTFYSYLLYGDVTARLDAAA